MRYNVILPRVVYCNTEDMAEYFEGNLFSSCIFVKLRRYRRKETYPNLLLWKTKF